MDTGRAQASLLVQVVSFIPDVLAMFVGVVHDPRVPRRAKLQAGALLVLGFSPLDLVPVLGELEVAAAIALAARQLLSHADEEVLREHWSGTPEGFRLLMTVVETGLRPRRILWGLAKGRV